MAAAAWILRKTDDKPVIDGIVYAAVNADNADAEAVVIAEAVATAIAAGHPLPAGYFNEADLFLAAGQFDTNEDGVFFTDRSGTEVKA